MQKKKDIAVMFQSTPPHGERLSFYVIIFLVVNVSIHAPAWGATFALPLHMKGQKGFNPRPRMGSDITGINSLLTWKSFQSTPPHGERLSPRQTDITSLKFQSTPPHGERHEAFLATGRCVFVSIHAPAWGATFVSGSCHLK